MQSLRRLLALCPKPGACEKYINRSPEQLGTASAKRTNELCWTNKLKEPSPHLACARIIEQSDEDFVSHNAIKVPIKMGRGQRKQKKTFSLLLHLILHSMSFSISVST